MVLVSAVNRRSAKNCLGYDIRIDNGRGPQYIERKQVEDILTNHRKLELKGKKLASLDLRSLEAKLKKNIWIRNAEIYVDNNQELQVMVHQKQPVARVFGNQGASFYLDSACERLPLAGEMPARVPVFTGYPGTLTSKADSSLLVQVKRLSDYLGRHPFWMAAIDQVSITGDRQFELIPTVGSHVVELGEATDLDKKFGRLYLFYKEVLVKTGFERYDRIKVQFDRQVVAVRKDRAERHSDSTRNVQMLNQLQQPAGTGLAATNESNTMPDSGNTLSSPKVHPMKNPNPYETARITPKPGGK